MLYNMSKISLAALFLAVLGFTTLPTVEAQNTNDQAFVDIVVEPQTYVPPHYTGRPLPTGGSRVRLIALVEEPGVTDPSDYRYTWRMGGRVIGGGVIEGRNTLFIDIPNTQPGQVSVEVARLGAGVVGSDTATLPTVETKMMFYPIHPLYGLQAGALTNTISLTSGNRAVQAAPYYLPLEAFSSHAETVYEWKIDRRNIPNTNQLNIDLQRNQLRDGASLDLRIFNRSNWQHGAQGTLQIAL